MACGRPQSRASVDAGRHVRDSRSVRDEVAARGQRWRAVPESVAGITFVRSLGPIQVCMRGESPGAGLRRFFDLSSYLQSVLATARPPQAGRQQRFHAQMENGDAA